MKGSHWGHKMGFDGKFFVFDCLQYKKDMKPYQLATRRKYITKAIDDIDRNNWDSKDEFIKGEFILRLPHYPIRDGWSLWYGNVKRRGYEGLVLKNSKSKYDDVGAWARIKNTTEVGAVIGSLIDKPCKIQCGGLTDEQRTVFTANAGEYVGRVFTATGHGWFPSGSVRHPKFSHWREDKGILECTYDQIPVTHRED